MKAFLLKYRSSPPVFMMFFYSVGSAAVVAKWQSDRETEETMHIEAAVDNWGLGFMSWKGIGSDRMPWRDEEAV